MSLINNSSYPKSKFLGLGTFWEGNYTHGLKHATIMMGLLSSESDWKTSCISDAEPNKTLFHYCKQGVVVDSRLIPPLGQVF